MLRKNCTRRNAANFLKKVVLLVSFRGQKLREPRPDWSPLGVNFKILDEHPYLFYISSPPPGDYSPQAQFLLSNNLLDFVSGIIRNYYSTIAPFYHIRAKERAKYPTLLHCRTGQKYGLKRSDKMAAQNEPNFALFTSFDLDFLTDDQF